MYKTHTTAAKKHLIADIMPRKFIQKEMEDSRRVQRGEMRKLPAEFSAEMKGSSRRGQYGRIDRSSSAEYSMEREAE